MATEITILKVGTVRKVNGTAPDSDGNVTITVAGAPASTDITDSTATGRQVLTAASQAAARAAIGAGTSSVAIGTGAGQAADAAATSAALAAKADLVGGVIPQAQIPAVALVTYLGAVASQSAMLALTGQPGDWCNRTDTKTSWQLTGTPASSLSSWTQMVYPDDAVSSVAGRAGAVTLAKADVGLGNVDNTSDTGKPVSTAQAAALAKKIEVVIYVPGTGWPAYSTDPTIVRDFRSQFDAAANSTPPTFYNLADSWLRVPS